MEAKTANGSPASCFVCETAMPLLERCFGEPFEIELLTLIGTASLGIALYPQDGATRDSLLDAADVSMYIAKNSKVRSSSLSASLDTNKT